MKRAWSVRSYKSGDKEGILELMKAVYPNKTFSKEKWLKWWRWMFRECPAGKARYWLADHDGKIVGQYPLIIADLKVGNKITKVGQNIELMTHPDYRKQGMFTTLERKTFEEATKEGIHITIGFPNAAAYPGHIKNDWFDIGSLQIGVKPLNLDKIVESGVKNRFLRSLYLLFGKIAISIFYREKKTPKSDKIVISEIKSFDNKINDFWKKISKEHEIFVVRNKDYLNWRYVDIPDIDYTIFVAKEEGEICGYIVLRCTEENGLNTGSIFEIVTSLAKIDVASSLINKAIEYFKSQNADLTYCLMIADKRFEDVFRKKGFIFSRFILDKFAEGGQFCAFSNHPKIPKSFLMNKNNWFIHLGDSDSL